MSACIAPTTILCLLSLGLSIVVATISYRFVELPFQRRKEAGRGPPAGAAPDEQSRPDQTTVSSTSRDHA